MSARHMFHVKQQTRGPAASVEEDRRPKGDRVRDVMTIYASINPHHDRRGRSMAASPSSDDHDTNAPREAADVGSPHDRPLVFVAARHEDREMDGARPGGRRASCVA